MESVNNRDIRYEGAASKGRPIERVSVNEIELGAALSQFEKKLEKEVGLGKETRIGAAFLYWLRKVGRKDVSRHFYRLDGDTGDERVIPGEKRHCMPTLYQALREVSEEGLRAAQIGLGNGGD